MDTSEPGGEPVEPSARRGPPNLPLPAAGPCDGVGREPAADDLAGWCPNLVDAPNRRAALVLAPRLIDAVHRPANAVAALAVIERYAADEIFWSTLLAALGPSASARLLDEISARQDLAADRSPGNAAADPDSGALCKAIGRGLVDAFAGAELDPSFREAFLDAAAWDDLYRLVDRDAAGGPLAGLLAARLTELGEANANRFAQQLGVYHYAEAIHGLGQRLRTDRAARRVFATSVRVFSRPADHRSSASDAWVVGVIDEEQSVLEPAERERLRLEVIDRIAAQGFVHPDFGPILVQLFAEDETLARLAAADDKNAPGATHGPCLGRQAARGFIEVLMRVADDPVEIEAAAWSYIQRQIEGAAARPAGGSLERAVSSGASLLALIHDSRGARRPVSGSSTQQGLPTASEIAVGEFIFVNRTLLSATATPVLSRGGLDLGEFIRRDGGITLPGIHFDRPAFERWFEGKSQRALLTELVLLALDAQAERQRRCAAPATDWPESGSS